MKRGDLVYIHNDQFYEDIFGIYLGSEAGRYQESYILHIILTPTGVRRVCTSDHDNDVFQVVR